MSGQAVRGASAPQVEVLLVEDDDGDALLVEEELAMVAGGPAVRRVHTIAAAADHGRPAPECVLLDLGLPDAQELDGLRALREALPDAAIVVLTGLADEQRGVEALAQGAQDYLVKGSVDGPLLARAIRYAVERRRAELNLLALREAELQALENTRLERGLLPRPIVDRRLVQIASAYRPGRRRALLGGDFFDAVHGRDGRLHVVIGDVAGHSADEAALGASLRIAWRTLVFNRADDDAVLPTLDRVLAAERHSEDAFATAATLTIAADRRAATLRLAGHPAPLLLNAGRATELDGAPAIPIGLGRGTAWPTTEVALEPGWSILLFTDGLIEGRTGAGHERLGVARLRGLLERATASPRWRADPDALLQTLIGDVEAINDGALTDDVATLLVCEQVPRDATAADRPPAARAPAGAGL